MARTREPTAVLLARGKSHLTKAEIAEHKAHEVAPIADEIKAPSFLSSVQKKEFDRIARQLTKLGIMGETDCDTLASYVVAESCYQTAVKEIRALQKEKPNKEDDPEGYFDRLQVWSILMDNAGKREDRYWKQASTLARDLGLTISSRCKLEVPGKTEEVKVNKFEAFAVKRA